MPNKTFNFPITLELIDHSLRETIHYNIKIGNLEYFFITEYKGIFSVRDVEGADYFPEGFASLDDAVQWFIKYLQGT